MTESYTEMFNGPTPTSQEENTNSTMFTGGNDMFAAQDNSSNNLVMDLLSQIHLDTLDDQAAMDSFGFDTQSANMQVPAFMPSFGSPKIMFENKELMRDGFIPHQAASPMMGHASPLSHMYSPLSEPHSPPQNQGQGQQQQTYEESQQNNITMFGSPTPSFHQSCLSPPMTPLMNPIIPSSPLMQQVQLQQQGGASPSSIHGSPQQTPGSPQYPIIQTTNSKKEPLYKCPCGKSFKKLHSLELHQKLHQSDRQYACTICHKRFLRPHDLKRHKVTHMEGYKPFECSNCGVTFTRQDAMQRHVTARRCQKNK